MRMMMRCVGSTSVGAPVDSVPVSRASVVASAVEADVVLVESTAVGPLDVPSRLPELVAEL
jgi:hypothetical protein